MEETLVAQQVEIVVAEVLLKLSVPTADYLQTPDNGKLRLSTPSGGHTDN